MRIAIDGMLLGGRQSGVEGSIANLVRALTEAGQHDCTLFMPSTGGRAGWDATGEGEGGGQATGRPSGERLAVVTTRWPVRFRLLRIFWEQVFLPGRLSRHRFDLLHAPGYVAPLLARVPVVLTLYDLIAMTHPELCTRSNRAFYRLLIPRSVRKATRIIVPSEATKSDVLRVFPAEAEKVRVVPLGIGAEFKMRRDEAIFDRMRRSYRLPGRFILFVGGLEPKKNLSRLIDAYHRLRRNPGVSQSLVIAGTPSWDQANVRESIRAQGLEREVILTGFVPPVDLPWLYNLADLFVFPSLYEGFGLPPLEAMACGTPVMVSDRGALPEIAGPAAVITDPLDPEKMAAAMHKLLSDQGLRGGLVARGLAHAGRYAWAATAAATAAVYEEAAGHV